MEEPGRGIAVRNINVVPYRRHADAVMQFPLKDKQYPQGVALLELSQLQVRPSYPPC